MSSVNSFVFDMIYLPSKLTIHSYKSKDSYSRFRSGRKKEGQGNIDQQLQSNIALF